MASTTNRWKLGLFVLTSIVLFLAAVLWLGASRLRRESIQAYYFFDEEVSGLELGAPVKFRGVTIGKVTTIQAAPDGRHVEVVSEIYLDSLERIGLDERPQEPGEGPFVPEDLRVQLITSLLTGVTFIQGDFFDVERHPVPEYPFEVPWNTVHTTPSTAKSLESGLVEVVANLPRLVDEVTLLVGDLRQGVADLRTNADALPLDSLVRETEAALVELRAFLAEARHEDGVLWRLGRRYDQLGRDLQAALDASELPATTAAVRGVGADVGRASGELELLLGEVRTEMDTLWQALESLRRLSDLLERDPAALLRGKTPTTRPR